MRLLRRIAPPILLPPLSNSLTGSTPSEGRYLRSSPMTAVWPLWAALKSGVAPSCERKRFRDDKPHTWHESSLSARYSTRELARDLRVSWRRPLRRPSTASWQRGRVPFATRSTTAWRRPSSPRPSSPRAPGGPPECEDDRSGRRWTTPWHRPAKP